MKVHKFWVFVTYLVGYLTIAAILSLFSVNLDFYWTIIPGLVVLCGTTLLKK
jgi:hypothetical protein